MSSRVCSVYYRQYRMNRRLEGKNTNIRNRLSLSLVSGRKCVPRKVALDYRHQLVARLELTVGDLDLDSVLALNFLRDEEVGEAVEGDVGFDEGGEDDGEDLWKKEVSMRDAAGDKEDNERREGNRGAGRE
jgi:hypothetical protein